MKTVDIAILTPYEGQIDLLRNAIPDCKVCTTDNDQCKIVDIVIFVTVRSNPHYDASILKDMRRLNMAMTRAKAGIIIIGDRVTLTGKAEGDSMDESTAVWVRLLRNYIEVRLLPAFWLKGREGIRHR